MFMKFVRFVAVLTILASIAGNSGVARADHGTPPRISAQNLEQPRAPESKPLNSRALTIPSASSLGVQFVHVATAANISASGVPQATVIDHPLTNGNPSAIIIVTPNYDPGGVIEQYSDHPIGVWYSGGKWRIFYQDIAAMPVGAAFNVIIPTPGTNVFVHTATSVSGNHTFIDNPLTNGNPNAIVSVTPNYNPGGISCPPACVYTNFPIGVYYDAGVNKWAVFNQNGTLSSMPTNASFNVSVLTAGTGIFAYRVTAGNTTGVSTYIDNALTDGHPNAIVFVTPNWDPGGVCPCVYNNHNIGVWYDGSQWIIFNQDGGAMPNGIAFNVLVLVPSSDIFVHKATAGNSSGNQTQIDNALTNSHPNAIVFTTPNWNPDGVVGTYNNHNIGVYYSSSAWRIFNQDVAAMPANAAFNVLIPNPDTSVFVHKATAANISAHITTIDYPLTNGKPNAIVFVTPNYDPGGVGAVYDDDPIGVYYVSSKWTIFNQDIVTMPVNAAFNVFVPTARPGVAVFVHTATAGNSAFDYTVIDNPLANGNRNAIVLVTPNYNPGGGLGMYANYRIGVYYNGSRWAIFNQDGSTAIPGGTAFNVYVDANYKIYLPLVMR